MRLSEHEYQSSSGFQQYSEGGHFWHPSQTYVDDSGWLFLNLALEKTWDLRTRQPSQRLNADFLDQEQFILFTLEGLILITFVSVLIFVFAVDREQMTKSVVTNCKANSRGHKASQIHRIVPTVWGQSPCFKVSSEIARVFWASCRDSAGPVRAMRAVLCWNFIQWSDTLVKMAWWKQTLPLHRKHSGFMEKLSLDFPASVFWSFEPFRRPWDRSWAVPQISKQQMQQINWPKNMSWPQETRLIKKVFIVRLGVSRSLDSCLETKNGCATNGLPLKTIC